MSKAIILGGGMTGLAAGMSSGLPVFEAAEAPGGICSSYYVRPGERARLHATPRDGEAYRFEIGGGHWIFGGDPIVLHFIESVTPVKRYTRTSAVYFREDDLYVPYPLQNNLRAFQNGIACRALVEIAKEPGPFRTMKEWQAEYFGPTLSEKFFFPFHDLYTAGLYDRIAPQDVYKSPIDIGKAIRGTFEQADAVGYNVTYVYPQDGLNSLAQHMAGRCDIRYGKRVVTVDVTKKKVTFADGSEQRYESLISTLPLNKMLIMAELSVDAEPDPYTSVLVLNIGATKGPSCPPYHWLYNPDAKSGFHRVGFYSNVDSSFLPRSAQEDQSAVSIYVERAYEGGTKPTEPQISDYCDAVVRELQEWGYIDRAEVVDPTWIDVAYTWSWPDSTWRTKALEVLESHDVFMIGRYGRWIFQGIADSIRDGFYAGACFNETSSPG